MPAAPPPLVRPSAPPVARPTPPAAPAGDGPTAGGRPTAGAELEACVLRRFDAATARRSDATMAALRAAVGTLVDRLKAHGLTSDEVVEAVEALLHEHGVARRGPALHGTAAAPSTWGGSSVAAQLLRWCARAYHDDAWW